MSEVWSWIDANGVAHPMNNFSEGIEVLEGVTGRGMPPIRVVRDIVAGAPGSRLRDVKHDLRATQVPIFIEGATETDVLDNVRAWVRNLDPARGDGTLLVQSVDGSVRELVCRYKAGLELDESADHRFHGETPGQLAVVAFDSDSPYWQDLVGQSLKFSTTTTPTVWFAGGTILPIVLGASAVVGGATVTIDSDVDVWPTWTITGPGSTLVIRNNGTGRQFVWGGTLTAGQVLTIDTRPGVKTVLREDGSNQFSHLTAWDLWPFEPGDNDVDVTMSGVTVASLIQVAWRNAHLTP